ncbi:DinB family protein [Egicoccus sp. AB-alg6-2]|uniref:DinB family protein n=1 Tax=Egicoccus sp. AB-alg6-2 TaxID=3242692 RepID=UPI00359CC610
MTTVCLEFGVGAHVDDATLAWVYDHRWWGLCGQGTDEASALADLTTRAARSYASFLERHGELARPLEGFEVVERLDGDELTFRLDHEPATDEEVERTSVLLGYAREELLSLIENCSDAELDWDDSDRRLPRWARWRTLRQMAFHIADTESRYYLAALNVDPPKRCADVTEELRRSRAHVRDVVARLERDRAVTSRGERWTTRKVLRRLAWHERSELDAMRALRDKARRAVHD